MLAEFILIAIIVLISLVVIIYKKNRLVDFFITNLSATPPSKDSQLEDLLEVAGRYYAEKNYLAAEKAYLKVLRVDHKNSLAYSRLGFIYSHLGNTEDAIECFQIVADTYPNAASYYNLAMMYFKVHEYNKSATALEKSLEMEMHFNRLVTLARIYRVQNKYDLQISALKKCVELQPKNIEAIQLYAEALLHQGKVKESNMLFRKILKIDPTNLRAKAALQPKSKLKKPL